MGAFVIFAALASLGTGNNGKVYWSPYQKLTLIPHQEGGETVSFALNTNDTWYQQIVDLSPKFVTTHPQYFRDEPVQWNPYNIPYHFYTHPPSVLVLGSGMGNDVAAALRNGAGRVVAVEIDPLILELGHKLHFENPYSSPDVHVVVDDARTYVQNSKDRFDLIVFSLLDSHTTSSYYTNIRIDNYVYTLEALKAARHLLKQDGIFIIKFQVDTPWVAGRLRGLLETVFGRAPLQLRTDKSPYGTKGTFFVAGSEERIAQAMSDAQLAAFVAEHSNIETQKAALTTDDWPYFYQREPGLPVPVMVIFRVFVTGGIGLARFSPTDGAKVSANRDFVDNPATISAENKFGFNFGGGVEAKMNSWSGVRFDLRDHMSGIPRFGVPQTAPTGDFYPVSGLVHNFETSLGLIFYLQR